MKTYLLAAFGVIFLTLLLSFISPEGKLKKTVNFVMRVACICVLISPVTDLFDLPSSAETMQSDYEYICREYANSQSIALQELIYEELGTDCDCEVSVIFENESIKENGVIVRGQFDDKMRETIVAYLRELGYINITVNEKGD